jgi:hypothetical protein
MASKSSWRSRTFLIALLVLLGALAIPAAATAEVQAFHRFEVDAIANYTITEICPDESTSTTRVNVFSGHEEEAENGETTIDRDFLTVRILNFRDCDGIFVNDIGSGPADFTFSPSLQTAAVTGTIATREGRSVTVDLTWDGTGPIEVDNNTTIFEGFTGHFQGQRRDAVASGTVVVDGETLVDGSTTNAEIETLEDTNIRH